MRIPPRRRASGACAILALGLVAFLTTPPGVPSIPEEGLEPPSLAEIYELEEVAEWVLGRPLSKGFQAITEQDITDAVRSRRDSFELFRGFGDDRTRREMVHGLPFGELIWSASRRHDVDGLLLASVVEAESGFDPVAVSPQGALGLMQIMPDTADLYSASEPLDPAVNIEVGARYLADLLELFDGDLALALAGYNAGPGNVMRYGDVPPFDETRAYVDRVLERYVDHQQAVWERAGGTSRLF